MKTRIYFQPASQIHNAGDQLINWATINAIRQYGEIVVNDLRTPEWFISGIGAGGDRRFSEFASKRFFVSLTWLLIKQRLSNDPMRNFLVFAPGHTSRTGFREARTALVWYAKLLLIRMLGCTVVRAGFSIGPFDRLNGWVESFASRCFSYYGLRDRQSLTIAEKLCFASPHYFPDLAWSFVPQQRCSPASNDGPVVISFRSNAYGLVHSTTYLAPIRERLGCLLSSPVFLGKRVVVVYQVQTDDEASRELFSYLKGMGLDVELIDRKLSIDEAASLYASACCAISNRLHVLLLAAQSGTLPIPLANMKDNVKITSILSDNGLSDLIVDLQEDEKTNSQRIQKIVQNRADLLRRLDEARQANTILIHKGFASAFGAP